MIGRDNGRAARRVLRLSRNERCRDFVVGDCRGAYDLVVERARLEVGPPFGRYARER